MRAFEIFSEEVGVTAIVYHESAGKARYAAYRSAAGAGWDVSLTRFTAKRRSDMDDARIWDGSTPKIGYSYAPDAFADATP